MSLHQTFHSSRIGSIYSRALSVVLACSLVLTSAPVPLAGAVPTLRAPEARDGRGKHGGAIAPRLESAIRSTTPGTAPPPSDPVRSYDAYHVSASPGDPQRIDLEVRVEMALRKAERRERAGLPPADDDLTTQYMGRGPRLAARPLLDLEDAIEQVLIEQHQVSTARVADALDVNERTFRRALPHVADWLDSMPAGQALWLDLLSVLPITQDIYERLRHLSPIPRKQLEQLSFHAITNAWWQLQAEGLAESIDPERITLSQLAIAFGARPNRRITVDPAHHAFVRQMQEQGISSVWLLHAYVMHSALLACAGSANQASRLLNAHVTAFEKHLATLAMTPEAYAVTHDPFPLTAPEEPQLSAALIATHLVFSNSLVVDVLKLRPALAHVLYAATGNKTQVGRAASLSPVDVVAWTNARRKPSAYEQQMIRRLYARGLFHVPSLREALTRYAIIRSPSDPDAIGQFLGLESVAVNRREASLRNRSTIFANPTRPTSLGQLDAARQQLMQPTMAMLEQCLVETSPDEPVSHHGLARTLGVPQQRLALYYPGLLQLVDATSQLAGTPELLAPSMPTMNIRGYPERYGRLGVLYFLRDLVQHVDQTPLYLTERAALTSLSPQISDLVLNPLLPADTPPYERHNTTLTRFVAAVDRLAEAVTLDTLDDYTRARGMLQLWSEVTEPDAPLGPLYDFYLTISSPECWPIIARDIGAPADVSLDWPTYSREFLSDQEEPIRQIIGAVAHRAAWTQDPDAVRLRMDSLRYGESVTTRRHKEAEARHPLPRSGISRLTDADQLHSALRYIAEQEGWNTPEALAAGVGVKTPAHALTYLEPWDKSQQGIPPERVRDIVRNATLTPEEQHHLHRLAAQQWFRATLVQDLFEATTFHDALLYILMRAGTNAAEFRQRIEVSLTAAGNYVRDGALPEPPIVEQIIRAYRLSAHEGWFLRRLATQERLGVSHIVEVLEDDTPFAQMLAYYWARRGLATTTLEPDISSASILRYVRDEGIPSKARVTLLTERLGLHGDRETAFLEAYRRLIMARRPMQRAAAERLEIRAWMESPIETDAPAPEAVPDWMPPLRAQLAALHERVYAEPSAPLDAAQAQLSRPTAPATVQGHEPSTIAEEVTAPENDVIRMPRLDLWHRIVDHIVEKLEFSPAQRETLLERPDVPVNPIAHMSEQHLRWAVAWAAREAAGSATAAHNEMYGARSRDNIGKWARQAEGLPPKLLALVQRLYLHGYRAFIIFDLLRLHLILVETNGSLAQAAKRYDKHRDRITARLRLCGLEHAAYVIPEQPTIPPQPLTPLWKIDALTAMPVEDVTALFVLDQLEVAELDAEMMGHVRSATFAARGDRQLQHTVLRADALRATTEGTVVEAALRQLLDNANISISSVPELERWLVAYSLYRWGGLGQHVESFLGKSSQWVRERINQFELDVSRLATMRFIELIRQHRHDIGAIATALQTTPAACMRTLEKLPDGQAALYDHLEAWMRAHPHANGRAFGRAIGVTDASYTAWREQHPRLARTWTSTRAAVHATDETDTKGGVVVVSIPFVPVTHAQGQLRPLREAADVSRAALVQGTAWSASTLRAFEEGTAVATDETLTALHARIGALFSTFVAERLETWGVGRTSDGAVLTGVSPSMLYKITEDLWTTLDIDIMRKVRTALQPRNVSRFLGQELQTVRETGRVSLTQLAQALEQEPELLANMETGQRVIPLELLARWRETLPRLCRAHVRERRLAMQLPASSLAATLKVYPTTVTRLEESRTENILLLIDKAHQALDRVQGPRIAERLRTTYLTAPRPRQHVAQQAGISVDALNAMIEGAPAEVEQVARVHAAIDTLRWTYARAYRVAARIGRKHMLAHVQLQRGASHGDANVKARYLAVNQLCGPRLRERREYAALDIDTVARLARLSVEALKRMEAGTASADIQAMRHVHHVLDQAIATAKREIGGATFRERRLAAHTWHSAIARQSEAPSVAGVMSVESGHGYTLALARKALLGLNATIGPRLRERRELAQFSQAALAEAVGVAPSLIAAIEEHRTVPETALLDRLHRPLDAAINIRYNETQGPAFRDRRLAGRIRITALASAVGVGRSTIRKVETHPEEITLETRVRIGTQLESMIVDQLRLRYEQSGVRPNALAATLDTSLDTMSAALTGDHRLIDAQLTAAHAAFDTVFRTRLSLELRARREAASISRDTLAALAGIAPVTLSQLEAGNEKIAAVTNAAMWHHVWTALEQLTARTLRRWRRVVRQSQRGVAQALREPVSDNTYSTWERSGRVRAPRLHDVMATFKRLAGPSIQERQQALEYVSNEQLAELAKVSTSSVVRAKAGESASLEMLETITSALDVVEYMLRGGGQMGIGTGGVPGEAEHYVPEVAADEELQPEALLLAREADDDEQHTRQRVRLLVIRLEDAMTRRVLELTMDNVQPRDIAEQTELSEADVTRRLHEGVRAIRDMFDAEDWSELTTAVAAAGENKVLAETHLLDVEENGEAADLVRIDSTMEERSDLLLEAHAGEPTSITWTRYLLQERHEINMQQLARLRGVTPHEIARDLEHEALRDDYVQEVLHWIESRARDIAVLKEHRQQLAQHCGILDQPYGQWILTAPEVVEALHRGSITPPRVGHSDGPVDDAIVNAADALRARRIDAYTAARRIVDALRVMQEPEGFPHLRQALEIFDDANEFRWDAIPAILQRLVTPLPTDPYERVQEALQAVIARADAVLIDSDPDHELVYSDVDDTLIQYVGRSWWRTLGSYVPDDQQTAYDAAIRRDKHERSAESFAARVAFFRYVPRHALRDFYQADDTTILNPRYVEHIAAIRAQRQMPEDEPLPVILVTTNNRMAVEAFEERPEFQVLNLRVIHLIALDLQTNLNGAFTGQIADDTIHLTGKTDHIPPACVYLTDDLEIDRVLEGGWNAINVNGNEPDAVAAAETRRLGANGAAANDLEDPSKRELLRLMGVAMTTAGLPPVPGLGEALTAATPTAASAITAVADPMDALLAALHDFIQTIYTADDMQHMFDALEACGAWLTPDGDIDLEREDATHNPRVFANAVERYHDARRTKLAALEHFVAERGFPPPLANIARRVFKGLWDEITVFGDHVRMVQRKLLEAGLDEIAARLDVPAGDDVVMDIEWTDVTDEALVLGERTVEVPHHMRALLECTHGTTADEVSVLTLRLRDQPDVQLTLEPYAPGDASTGVHVTYRNPHDEDADRQTIASDVQFNPTQDTYPPLSSNDAGRRFVRAVSALLPHDDDLPPDEDIAADKHPVAHHYDYEYDAEGRLQRVVDAHGHVWEAYAYVGDHMTVHLRNLTGGPAVALKTRHASPLVRVFIADQYTGSFDMFNEQRDTWTFDHFYPIGEKGSAKHGQWQGQGIGWTILNWMTHGAQRQGCALMNAGTTNVALLTMYQRLFADRLQTDNMKWDSLSEQLHQHGLFGASVSGRLFVQLPSREALVELVAEDNAQRDDLYERTYIVHYTMSGRPAIEEGMRVQIRRDNQDRLVVVREEDADQLAVIERAGRPWKVSGTPRPITAVAHADGSIAWYQQGKLVRTIVPRGELHRPITGTTLSRQVNADSTTHQRTVRAQALEQEPQTSAPPVPDVQASVVDYRIGEGVFSESAKAGWRVQPVDYLVEDMLGGPEDPADADTLQLVQQIERGHFDRAVEALLAAGTFDHERFLTLGEQCATHSPEARAQFEHFTRYVAEQEHLTKTVTDDTASPLAIGPRISRRGLLGLFMQAAVDQAVGQPLRRLGKRVFNAGTEPWLRFGDQVQKALHELVGQGVLPPRAIQLPPAAWPLKVFARYAGRSVVAMRQLRAEYVEAEVFERVGGDFLPRLRYQLTVEGLSGDLITAEWELEDNVNRIVSGDAAIGANVAIPSDVVTTRMAREIGAHREAVLDIAKYLDTGATLLDHVRPPEMNNQLPARTGESDTRRTTTDDLDSDAVAAEQVLHDMPVRIDRGQTERVPLGEAAVTESQRIVAELVEAGYLSRQPDAGSLDTAFLVQRFFDGAIENAMASLQEQWSAAPARAEIHLRVVLRDGVLWCEVHDNGTGFPAALLPWIGREDPTEASTPPNGMNTWLYVLTQGSYVRGEIVRIRNHADTHGAVVAVGMPQQPPHIDVPMILEYPAGGGLELTVHPDLRPALRDTAFLHTGYIGYQLLTVIPGGQKCYACTATSYERCRRHRVSGLSNHAQIRSDSSLMGSRLGRYDLPRWMPLLRNNTIGTAWRRPLLCR